MTLNLYLADDDNEDRELFVEALDEIDVPTKITQFDNGVDLMDDLFSTIDLPDAVFLDLNMPLMNGFECLTDIRNFPRFDDIKVIVYSTSYRLREVNQLQTDGANQYIQKPSSFEDLKVMLHKSLVSLIEKNPSAANPAEFVILV
ncbi:response regulator [Zobellia amurskyensis]|uniref:Response regulator n=1 Tax=Zobellia amurskyensis TaxID=248905 RepID=A0A7X3D4C6_9FLAO|nr:response regulator [Zobellia amurskyensis]MUH38238.1 response regulator [Zobellia amurskyensis]